MRKLILALLLTLPAYGQVVPTPQYTSGWPFKIEKAGEVVDVVLATLPLPVYDSRGRLVSGGIYGDPSVFDGYDRSSDTFRVQLVRIRPQPGFNAETCYDVMRSETHPCRALFTRFRTIAVKSEGGFTMTVRNATAGFDFQPGDYLGVETNSALHMSPCAKAPVNPGRPAGIQYDVYCGPKFVRDGFVYTPTMDNWWNLR